MYKSNDGIDSTAFTRTTHNPMSNTPIRIISGLRKIQTIAIHTIIPIGRVILIIEFSIDHETIGNDFSDL